MKSCNPYLPVCCEVSTVPGVDTAILGLTTWFVPGAMSWLVLGGHWIPSAS